MSLFKKAGLFYFVIVSDNLANSSRLSVSGLLCGSMPAEIITSLMSSPRPFRELERVFLRWEKAVLTSLKNIF